MIINSDITTQRNAIEGGNTAHTRKFKRLSSFLVIGCLSLSFSALSSVGVANFSSYIESSEIKFTSTVQSSKVPVVKVSAFDRKGITLSEEQSRDASIRKYSPEIQQEFRSMTQEILRKQRESLKV